MNVHTGMGAAFARAGLSGPIIELDIAIAKFLNQTNDDIVLLQERVRRAIESAGKVQALSGAQCALVTDALSRQPVEGDVADSGLSSTEDRNRNSISSSPNRDGAGHFSGAGNGHTRASRPVREPSVSSRDAAREVAQVIALTVLDTFRVRDGRSIGDVRIGELGNLRAKNEREAHIIRQIQEHGVADRDSLVRDFIKAPDMEKFIRKAGMTHGV